MVVLHSIESGKGILFSRREMFYFPKEHDYVIYVIYTE